MSHASLSRSLPYFCAWDQTVSPPTLGVILCEYADEPHIVSNRIHWASFLSQTVYAYLHSAWRGELRKLAKVAKGSEKDALRGFRLIEGIELAPVERACVTSY